MTLDGASVQAIAKALGISRTTVYTYQKDQSRSMRTRRPEAGRKATLSRINQDKLLKAFTSLNCNAAALTFLLHKEPQNFGLQPGFSPALGTYSVVAQRVCHGLPWDVTAVVDDGHQHVPGSLRLPGRDPLR